MKMMIEFTMDEVQENIPYALVCETMGGSRWNTMRRKRQWCDLLSETEQRTALNLYKRACDWYLGRGVPERVVMSPSTYKLWEKLGVFCAGL